MHPSLGKNHTLAPLLIGLLALGSLALACGDEEEVDPNAIACSSSKKLKVVGAVGDIDANFETGSTIEGQLTPRRITLDLGEVEYQPVGATEPELRSRIIVLQTNLPDPSGRELLANIELSPEQDGERTFNVVSRPLDTYCDVQGGELCVRFGLDQSNNQELVEDNVIHEGISGTITFTRLNSSSLAANWSIDVGPNIQNEFDMSTGTIEGCFDALIGLSQGENTFPLE